MIFTILLAILAAFLAVSAIILLAPIRVSCFGSVKGSSASAEILGWWLHPKVLRCVVDIKKKAVFVFACGNFRIFPSGTRESPEKKEPVAPPKDLFGNGKKEPLPEPQKQRQQERPSFSSRESPHISPEDLPKAEKHEETPEEQNHVDAEDTDEKEKPSFSEKLIPLKKIMVFLKDPSFRTKILRWLGKTVKGVFRAISVSKVTAQVKAGLLEPGLTGVAYGYFTGLKNMISTEKSSRGEILFEPVFNNEPFAAEGGIEISSSIARLCLPVIFAVLTFPYLHAYILYRRAKKIGRK
jgi:hypothetical protein